VDPVKHERSYANNAHYENIDRPNYHLLAEARVRRILLDNKTATGVEFVYNSETWSITAAKEVILSAGSVHTPQLLQVSGIGPKKVIEAAGLETLVDLPGVGQNFQDHSPIEADIRRTLNPSRDW
jgi:choline dehydrogenase